MKRSDVTNHLRFAGYHNDQRAFTRLYIENQISLSAAKEAYASGERARAVGVKCTCPACKEATN